MTATKVRRPRAVDPAPLYVPTAPFAADPCICCGRPLSRWNPTDTCGPCVVATRDRRKPAKRKPARDA